MKAGISFMLGLLLAFVVIFGYWLRTPHSLGTRWNVVLDHGVAHADLFGDHATR